MRERFELDQILANCNSVKLTFTEPKKQIIEDILFMNAFDFIRMFDQGRDLDKMPKSPIYYERILCIFRKHGDNRMEHTVGEMCQLLSQECKERNYEVDDEFFELFEGFIYPFHAMINKYAHGDRT